MIFYRVLFAFLFLNCLNIKPAYAETNLLFIIDGSNSMWGQVDQIAKIETAKAALIKLTSDLPKESNVGLMAYGHRAEGDCKDVEILSDIALVDDQSLKDKINKLQPKGKTPIAYALEQSKEVFKGNDGQNNHIVLISDGIESCAGDPCAAAAALNDSGINVKAHVVGFGLSKGDSQQLSCIANNTGGKYFDASNTIAFNEAIKEVTALAREEPEPISNIVFEDDFDGNKLSEQWKVTNANLDQYIVESGDLLLVAKDVGGLSNPESSNILTLLQDLPSGNWSITLEFTPDFQTSRDVLSIGIYNDNENYIAASLKGTDNFCCDWGNRTYNVALQIEKFTGGERTGFESPTTPVKHGPRDFKTYIEQHGINKKSTVKLVKEGRAYKSMFHREGQQDENGTAIWVETDSVSSLRAPKKLVINAGQSRKTNGESTFHIHSVVIESLQ